MSNRIVIVASSPGAGKTTIISSVAGNGRYTIVNMGTLMLDIAMKGGYVEHRDQLRFLPNETMTALRNAAFKHIAQLPGRVIVDTHASVEQNGRYLPGLPVDAVNLLKGGLAGFIYIDASTEDVMKRRKSDKTRKRENEDSALVDLQRLINIAALSHYSSHFNVPLYVIINRQNQLGISVESFRGKIKEIFGETT